MCSGGWWGKQVQRGETSKEMTAMIQARDGGALDQDGSSRDDEK